jgi:hypothetical protein
MLTYADAAAGALAALSEALTHADVCWRMLVYVC